MDVSLQEAATLLGKSTRTLRLWIRAGRLPAKKLGGRWVISKGAVPLSDQQAADLRSRADRVLTAVEEALPPDLSGKRGEKRKTLMDVVAFRRGLACAQSLPKSSRLSGVRSRFEQGLLAVARAHAAWAPSEKIGELREARACFAEGQALLLIETGESPPKETVGLLQKLEEEVIPTLGGMIRWAESLGRKRA